jgi:hypothetical protein
LLSNTLPRLETYGVRDPQGNQMGLQAVQTG